MSTTITMADVIIINTILYNKITSIDCESNRIKSLPLRSFRLEVGENRFVMVAKQQNRNKAKIQATVIKAMLIDMRYYRRLLRF